MKVAYLVIKILVIKTALFAQIRTITYMFKIAYLKTILQGSLENAYLLAILKAKSLPSLMILISQTI